jgi:CheY-like chemotaxis protein
VSHYILVVEDDPSIREALCEALELEGYQAVGAEHGKAALDYLARSARPCLILLDLMMPVMDGRSFRAAMLEDEELAQVPVVAITAGGAQLASTVAVDRVLFKPLRMDTVVDVVKEHCQTADA